MARTGGRIGKSTKKARIVFICTDCGETSPRWYGQCLLFAICRGKPALRFTRGRLCATARSGPTLLRRREGGIEVRLGRRLSSGIAPIRQQRTER